MPRAGGQPGTRITLPASRRLWATGRTPWRSFARTRRRRPRRTRIAAEASDKELVERIASTLRQTFDGLLDDANAQYAQRLAAVQEQYREYLIDAEQRYAERMEAEQRHNVQIVAEMRAHAETIERQSDEAQRYLKRLVRVLAVAVVVLMILLGVFAAYGVYAFNAFDRGDPSRGLYQVNTVQQNSE